MIVVLDPGHGGADHGCSAGGLREKDLVLSISQQIDAVLNMSATGVHVGLTRYSDKNLTLNEAGVEARVQEADLVIAVHVDAAAKPDVRGQWAIFLPEFGDVSKKSKLAAEAFLRAMPGSLRGRYRDPAADMLATAATNKPGTEDDWLQRARNVLLPHSHAPSFLVELGFLTNQKDRDLLGSIKGQAEIAISAAAGILQARHALGL